MSTKAAPASTPAVEAPPSAEELKLTTKTALTSINTTNSAGPMPGDYPNNGAEYDRLLSIRPDQGLHGIELVQWVIDTAEKGNPESVLAAFDEHCSKEGNWHMNVGPEKGQILDAALLARKPMVTMEWGAYLGYSSIRMGAIVKQWGGRVVSLEYSAERCALAASLVAHAGLSDTVTFIAGPASEGLVKYLTMAQAELKAHKAKKGKTDNKEVPPSQEKPVSRVPQIAVDLIFLDHVKDLYLSDTLLAQKLGLIVPGTVLVADNVIFPGCPDYLLHVRAGRNGYTSAYYPAHLEYSDKVVDGVEVSTFSPNLTQI